MDEADALHPDARLSLAFGTGRNGGRLRRALLLDRKLAAAFLTSGEAMLIQLRLAWWRDQIGSPDAARILQQHLTAHLPAIPLSDQDRRHLVSIVDGWEALLEDHPLPNATLQAYAAGRGEGLFAIAGEDVALLACGRAWALADFALHCSDAKTAARARELAALSAGSFAAVRRSSETRPLRILANLAFRDLAAGRQRGGVARILSTWSYLIFGR